MRVCMDAGNVPVLVVKSRNRIGMDIVYGLNNKKSPPCGDIIEGKRKEQRI